MYDRNAFKNTVNYFLKLKVQYGKKYMKKVSIVMATYNGEKYIKEQLESLYKQTYKDYELIIMDDCSIDNTVNIVNDYIRRNEIDNWNIYINRENLGWRRNFIEGLKRAKGEYIFLADQDDIWIEDKIKKVLEVMEDNDWIEVIAHNYNVFCEEGYSVNDKYASTKYGVANINCVKDKKYINNMIRPGCCMCMKKNIGMYITETWVNGCAHDSAIWRLAMLRGTLYIYNECLILHRRHSDTNTPHSNKSSKKRKARIIPYIELYQQFEEKNIGMNKILLYESKEYLKYRVGLINNKSKLLSLDFIKYYKYYPKMTSIIADFFSSNNEWGDMDYNETEFK